jgi:hypothetical protein
MKIEYIYFNQLHCTNISFHFQALTAVVALVPGSVAMVALLSLHRSNVWFACFVSSLVVTVDDSVWLLRLRRCLRDVDCQILEHVIIENFIWLTVWGATVELSPHFSCLAFVKGSLGSDLRFPPGNLLFLREVQSCLWNHFDPALGWGQALEKVMIVPHEELGLDVTALGFWRQITFGEERVMPECERGQHLQQVLAVGRAPLEMEKVVI